MIYRGESLAGFPADQVSPEHAVVERAFPVLLICDANDVALPCRHAQRIYNAARGPKEMWIVPGASHTAAISYEPDEFRRRVLGFFRIHSVNLRERAKSTHWCVLFWGSPVQCTCVRTNVLSLVPLGIIEEEPVLRKLRDDGFPNLR